MNSHVSLIRMDSASYTCCYGNDIYSFQVRCPESAVIFFPGDIQDSESKMSESSIAQNFTDFSYEQTLQILHSKYKQSNIFIVRPSLKSEDISLYGKYLDCDKNGNVQKYDPNGFATQALFLLIENYLCNDIDDLPIILIGFSRGGLVLNQILSEMGYSVYSSAIFSRVCEMHWLDCGNGEKDNCYPVLSDTTLSFLSQFQNSLRFYFHLTSYLYTDNQSCPNYYQLTQLINQLQVNQLFVFCHFYSSEFLYSLLHPSSCLGNTV